MEEAVPVSSVTESLGAAGFGGGKSAGDISKFQAVLDFGAADELMQKAGIKAVARTDGIDNDRCGRAGHEFFLAAAGNNFIRSAFDHNQGNLLR